MSQEPFRRLSPAPRGLLTALDNIEREAYWPGEVKHERQEIRVVLIKPTDQLLIGNIGEVSHEDVEALAEALRRLGFARPSILFERDITIGVSHGQDVEA